MRRYLNKFVSIALIFILCVLSLTACSVSNKVKMPSNVNDEQIELINYVVENGQYNDEQNSYYIQKKYNQDDGEYITVIAYNTETLAFTFTEMFSDTRRNGTTLTSMKYVFGEKEQGVLHDMMVGDDSFRATGTINTDTYSRKNTKIHSYKATDEHEEFIIVAEYSVLSLLVHTQSTLKDIGFSLETFGFENLSLN